VDLTIWAVEAEWLITRHARADPRPCWLPSRLLSKQLGPTHRAVVPPAACETLQDSTAALGGRTRGIHRSTSKFIPLNRPDRHRTYPSARPYTGPRMTAKPTSDMRLPCSWASFYDDGTNYRFGMVYARVSSPSVVDRLEVPNPNPSVARARETVAEWFNTRPPNPCRRGCRQLGVIHGLSYTPDVRCAAFADWGDDPYGRRLNSWNIGVKATNRTSRNG